MRRTIGSPRGRRPMALRLLAAGVGLVLIALMIDSRIRPIIKAYGTNQAQTLATMAVNNAVTQVLAGGEYTYDGLIHIQKGPNGDIQSAEADIVSINRLKAATTTAVLEELAKKEYQEFRIPLGDLIGGEYFTGRGPRIPIRISMNGTALSNISSSFASAGINQTRHEILLTVELNVSLVLPDYVTNLTTSTDFMVAETILKGDVPDAYAQIDGQLGLGTLLGGAKAAE